jgi:hypothetical protein
LGRVLRHPGVVTLFVGVAHVGASDGGASSFSTDVRSDRHVYVSRDLHATFVVAEPLADDLPETHGETALPGRTAYETSRMAVSWGSVRDAERPNDQPAWGRPCEELAASDALSQASVSERRASESLYPGG